MKRILSIYIGACLIAVSAFSQNVTDKDLEKEIKLSGRYYFGEAISVNDTAGKQEARGELFAYISRDFKQLTEGDIVASGVNYLSFPRGAKVRIIAYILIADVINIPKKQHELQINEIKYSDNKTSRTDSIKNNVSNPVTDIVIDKRNDSLKNTNLSRNDRFVGSLLNVLNFDELKAKLDVQKYKGRLIYGNESAFTSNRDKCYVIILNTDLVIEAILGPGILQRFDFKSNRNINNYREEFINTNEIWVFFID